MRYTSLFILTVLCFGAALLLWRPDGEPSGGNNGKRSTITDGAFRYRLHTPDATVSLSKKLDEVSGLAYVKAHTLAMINDEEGLIFLWDTRTEEIVEEIDFGKSGDYEGIAVSGARAGGANAYVLRSDGDVYRVANFLTRPQTEKYENPLRGDNDTEGLAYDPSRKNLLIVCKATGYVPGYADSPKVLVYQFSPSFPDKLVPFLTAEERTLRPSGLAIHPLTGHYYLLSSADGLLTIFDDDNQLIQQSSLPKKLFPQPEGICFLPDGTLYIANEKKKDRATLLQFNPHASAKP